MIFKNLGQLLIRGVIAAWIHAQASIIAFV
jgi:hypothetical protein